MAFCVQPVVPADLDELVAMLEDYCRFYGAAPGAKRLRALAQALLDDPVAHGVQLIARDAVRAAGFATVYWSWSTTRAAPIAVMNDLYVVPAARRLGLAEQLIGACLGLARSRGACALEWQTALDNHAAQRVYDRVGGRRSHWLSYELDPAGDEGAA